MAETDHIRVLNATRARQGFRGRHVLWMLVISMILVFGAMWLAWGSRSHQAPSSDPNHRADQAAAGTYDLGAPAARQTAP